MTETRELVDELRKIGGHGFPNWADEAANTIKAQAERIEAGLADIREGRTIPADSVFARIAAKHGWSL